MTAKDSFPLKLGLNPSRIDVRNLQFAEMLSPTVPLPPIPESFDIDQISFKENMFGNDMWGDCVMAWRANQTLRFEYCSQKKQIPITTNEVLNEYWIEQGYKPSSCFLKNAVSPKPDGGLSMLDSLTAWRKNGWQAAGKHYDIYAFLQLPVANDWWGQAPTNPTLAAEMAKADMLLGQAMYLLNGAGIAVNMTNTTMKQFKANKNWDLTDPIDRTIIGGHAIYFTGKNTTGPVAISWGKKVQLTWAWWHVYSSEAFCIVDNKDNFLPSDPINIPLLESYMNAIGAQ